MIIALHWREWLDDLRVERFADSANADAYTESLPADRTAFIIDTDKQGWGERLFVWQQQYTMKQLGQIASAVGRYQLPPNFARASVTAVARRLEDLILDEVRNKELTKYDPQAIFADIVNLDQGITDMAKGKMGEFKQVSASSGLGKVLKAHFEFDDLTVTDTAAQIGLEPMQVIGHLKTARKTHGIDHRVDPISKVVTIVLPVGVEPDAVLKEPTPGKEPRQYKIGEFRPVRRDGNLGKLVSAAKPGDIVALADIAEALNINPDAVLADLKSLRRLHGFQFTVTDNMVELKVPEGKEPFIATAHDLYGVTPTPRAPSGKRGEADALAMIGVMPDKPIIASESNKHRQKHFDALAKLAEDGEWNKVAAYHMNGVDSYSHMINRYRDRLLAAHNAQAVKSDLTEEDEEQAAE